MKRSVLFAALLLSVLPLNAAPKNYGSITTRDGKTYYECQVMHIYPDGVTFAHRNGASRIPFAELPESLRSEFRYDPKAEAEYQKQQAAVRKAEQERQKQQEIAMQERLLEAKMAEASYLASASQLATTAPAGGNSSPSWVGTPITGPAVGGRGYSGSSYSRFGYPYGYSGSGYYSGGIYSGISYGYPYGGYSYGSYYPGYGGYSYGGYPYYSGYSYGGYPSYGGYYGGGYRPTISGQWNIGHGIHIGIGGGGGGFGGMHHHH